ncbi:MAG: cytochrome C [Epsilonproteobacteria bacterium]|nr:cytochrome C [Campylobacterota bacterium]
MKKLIITAMISTSIAMASNYTQEERIKDMQIMAHAMQDIQNGFFYNNFDMIKSGGVLLTDTVAKIEPPLEEQEENDVMTRFLNNKVKMTNSVKKKIKQKTQDMIERFRDGDPTQALQSFTKITKECMKCHTQLRKW